MKKITLICLLLVPLVYVQPAAAQILNDEQMKLFEYFVGAFLLSSNGIIGVQVTDCNGNPISGEAVTLARVSADSAPVSTFERTGWTNAFGYKFFAVSYGRYKAEATDKTEIVEMKGLLDVPIQVYKQVTLEICN